MSNSAKRKPSSSITCPHCSAPTGGSFSTVVKSDDSGPTKILYKCKSCGGFYTAEKVVSWRVIKS